MSILKQNIFVWLSGGDPDALERSTIAEQRKYIKLGIVILVPAVLSWAGMWFACPYIDITGWPRIITSLIWSLIILSIDTYLVSTLDKRMAISNKKSYRKIAGFRIAISIFLGIIISHPLILKVLEANINEEIDNMKNERILQILSESRDSTIAWNKHNAEAIRNIDTIIKHKEVLMRAEGNGEKIITEYGNSYGKPNRGFRYKKIETEIDYLQKQRDSVIGEIKNTILLFKNKATKDTALVKTTFSADYLKRTTALAHLKQKDKKSGEWISHTSLMVWMLLIFLILLDSIAVLSKILSPSGQYEEMLSSHERRLTNQNVVQTRNSDQIENESLNYKLQMVRAIYGRASYHSPEAIRRAIDSVLGRRAASINTPQPINERRRTMKQIIFMVASTALGIILWQVLKQPVFNMKNEDIQIAMAIYLAAISIYGGFLK